MSLSHIARAVALCLCCFPDAATATCSDLSLVLAIDSSSSIDNDEFALQNLGYAAAFRSRAVQRAIAAAGIVDVAVIYWADADFSNFTLPWHRITSAQDADALAVSILSAKRQIIGDTDIGTGLNAAIDMLEDPNRCSIRAIVNVSGDGRESVSRKRKLYVPLAVARERAAELGIIVNGLAIANEVPELAQYYQDKLISGLGSFVMEVKDFTAFGEAIEQKLAREISPSLFSILDLVSLH